MYAKKVLLPDGAKAYLPIDSFDQELYSEASRDLHKRRNAYPVAPIEPGYNTNQALGYGYTQWHEMFNDRQLLCLGTLGKRIREARDEAARELLFCLFSGVLEFNNMFASFKGEGTGAVRHMFAHHILKPERTPLEANVWGTPHSSGAFSTLFKSRLLRAVSYAEDPFELSITHEKGKPASKKVRGLSVALRHETVRDFAEFSRGGPLYLSCGDSSQTDLATGSVDAVVTDPPFFDNVHYSELADFFYVWQQHFLCDDTHAGQMTTRSPAEVQNADPEVFAERLGAVFCECHRVLKADGLLVFTYHHSHYEGWRSVLKALIQARFGVTATQPVKSEMAVAVPKHQAAEPINFDIIIVCRKLGSPHALADSASMLKEATRAAKRQVKRLKAVGFRLSRNDAQIILESQLVRRLSRCGDTALACNVLEGLREAVNGAATALAAYSGVAE